MSVVVVVSRMRSATAAAVLIGVVIGAAGVYLLVGGSPATLLDDSPEQPLTSEGEVGVDPGPTPVPSPTAAQPPTYQFSVDQTQNIFVNLLNAERERRGLDPVVARQPLQDLAVEHARAMHSHQRVAHSGVDDEGVNERFRDAGLLPECEIPTPEQMTVHAKQGVEVLAGPPVDEPIYGAFWAEGDTYQVHDEGELAYALVQMWLQDRFEREKILLPEVKSVGLGFVIDDGGRAYVALELCGGRDLSGE